eukprot:2555304-Pyramimonas_sp.AAC.1
MRRGSRRGRSTEPGVLHQMTKGYLGAWSWAYMLDWPEQNHTSPKVTLRSTAAVLVAGPTPSTPSTPSTPAGAAVRV